MNSRFLLTIPLVSMFGLTACMDSYQTNPGTGANTKAQTGAILGAAVGGIIGATSDDDKLAKGVVGAAIGGARKTYRQTEQNAPMRSNATLEAVGGTAVYLASEAGACTTGEIIRVDGGYHVLGMPQSENL